ncbi:MFS family permease [Actinoplanes octamycinicus]|uniref:MFS family permease n=1 Tax=Actinoplanes octamycinicus TaxID=135948 RepID=A0A7W7GXT7_9ACTN|nr:MFS transporter [Actinoplanes octamycinicus]MBB4740248.1 MFS family permease [Actinoplanes octamycinicus]GIE63461.1 MFS transporter [Actinoplanes octamycinicus]
MSEQQAGYREIFAVREYRHLFAANLLSLIGDQLTAVALSFLVYQRSGSPLLAALTFAGSYLTWVVGGPLLAVLADRLPRRRVLIGADLIRAALVLLMLLPGMPVPLLVAIAFVANLCRPPFQSARASLLPDILRGDRYPVANGLDNIVAEVTQVAGFALGGLLVTAGSAQLVLAADAATFLISAALITTGLRRCAAATEIAAEPSGSWWAETTAGVRVVFTDRTLRSYLLLFWLACLVYATEGVVAPLAGEYGGGARTGGLLLAMMPAGVAIGGVLLTRFCGPDLRERLMLPLAVLSCAVLLPVAARPPLPVVLILLFVSGLAGAFSIPLNGLFGRAVPAAYRARAFGVAMSGLCAVQGLAMLGAGAAAEWVRPSLVVGGVALLATLAVLAVLAGWPTVSRRWWAWSGSRSRPSTS